MLTDDWKNSNLMNGQINKWWTAIAGMLRVKLPYITLYRI